MKIELDAPNLSENDKEALTRCIDSGYISTFGPYVPEFEEKFAEYIGSKRAVSVQSGTAAIHIALYELRIGKGDEVIVPALTFIATVNPVIYLGAVPVFCDVDRKTWNIDPERIEEAITEKTKAIIPVHLYGNPCNMDRIVDIAERHGLYIIEDATESLGASYKGRHTGTFGEFGCFSFNGNKLITTGGGGMVIGRSIDKLEHIKFLANQARNEKGYHTEIGFNYRMTNLEASLGLSQMDRIEWFLEKKREFNRIYRKELEGIVQFQEEREGAESCWWLTCGLFGTDVEDLQKRLKEKGVPTRRVFMPIPEFSPYKRYRRTDLANSYYIYERGLCLPSSTLNSEDDIHKVCKVMKEII